MKNFFALLSCILGLSLGLSSYALAEDTDKANENECSQVDSAEPNAESPGKASDSVDKSEELNEDSTETASASDNNAPGDNEDSADTISEEQTCEELAKPEHVSGISPYPKGKIIQAKIQTSIGELSCELYVGDHPMTVLNFISLATGKPAWNDASGKVHHDAYYKDLKFIQRNKNRYVVSSLRDEGTDFVIVDERCVSHGMDAGAIAMVQPYPGMASSQFILLADNVPAFKGMYPVFGKCGPVDLIKEMTKKDVTLNQIFILDDK